MQIGHIEGSTRTIGKSQGYLGLPIRDELIECKVSGNTKCMVSAWFPTPKELEDLRNGAAIHIRILGDSHPPIMVSVGKVPE